MEQRFEVDKNEINNNWIRYVDENEQIVIEDIMDREIDEETSVEAPMPEREDDEIEKSEE